ncbi:hypothetical protein HDU93_002154, partial [Gonapodya sp. JEL0774]
MSAAVASSLVQLSIPSPDSAALTRSARSTTRTHLSHPHPPPSSSIPFSSPPPHLPTSTSSALHSSKSLTHSSSIHSTSTLRIDDSLFLYGYRDNDQAESLLEESARWSVGGGLVGRGGGTGGRDGDGLGGDKDDNGDELHMHMHMHDPSVHTIRATNPSVAPLETKHKHTTTAHTTTSTSSSLLSPPLPRNSRPHHPPPSSRRDSAATLAGTTPTNTTITTSGRAPRATTTTTTAALLTDPWTDEPLVPRPPHRTVHTMHVRPTATATAHPRGPSSYSYAYLRDTLGVNDDDDQDGYGYGHGYGSSGDEYEYGSQHVVQYNRGGGHGRSGVGVEVKGYWHDGDDDGVIEDGEGYADDGGDGDDASSLAESICSAGPAREGEAGGGVGAVAGGVLLDRGTGGGM